MSNKSTVKAVYKNYSILLSVIFITLFFFSSVSASPTYTVLDDNLTITSQFVNFAGGTFINITNYGVYNFTAQQPFSIGVIFKTNVTNGTGMLFSKDGTGFGYSYEEYFDTNGKINCRVSGIVGATAANLNNSLWKFAFCTFNRNISSSAGLIPYINNVQSGSSVNISSVALNNLTNSSNLLIGRRPAGQYFLGDIAKVYLFNFTLQANRINNIYTDDLLGLNTPRIPVIYYHSLDDADPSNLETDLINFTHQMDYLNQSGYKTITFQQYINYTHGLYVLPAKPVIINFDDGYKSVFTNATIIMNNYSFVGVVGIITNLVGQTNYMNWTDILNLSQSGWEIASHSLNHDAIPLLSDAEIIRNFNESRYAILGNISYMPRSFIYPYNNYSLTTGFYCNQYYSLCSANNSGSTNPLMIDRYSNSTYGGIYRIGIGSSFTINNFINAVDKYNGAVLKVDLTDTRTTSTIAYDGSYLNNNANITNGILLNYTLNITDGYIDNITTTNSLVISNNNYNRSYSLNVNSFSDALIYYSNLSVECTTISSCDNSINLTLNKAESIYVLDNFNLTEGTIRQFSPLSFSQSTLTVKTISSNLTSSITASVITSQLPECEEISRMRYTPSSGAASDWTGQQAKAVCNSLKNEGYSLLIGPGSNQLQVLEQGSTPLASNILKVLIGFLALTVLAFSLGGMYIYLKNNFDSISTVQFVEYAIGTLVFTIFMVVLINVVLNYV